MAEIRQGIRHLLAAPFAYDSLQRVLGAYAWRHREILRHAVPALPQGARVLDIGCGTADILEVIPQHARYYGFDRNERYIVHARNRFRGRQAIFVCDDFSGATQAGGERFDLILALGLLHHLDDKEVSALMEIAKSALTDNGAMITLDPVRTPDQSAMARYLVDHDRGQNVRSPTEYARLARAVFQTVEMFLDPAPLWVPYTGVTLRCSR